MSTFKFTLPNGRLFELKGPPGFSFDQAKAIFDKQAAAGSLVGIKPGGMLSAATQAAQGLRSAQANLSQAQAGIAGAAGAGAAALGAAGGALSGSIAGIAAGLTGAVGVAAAVDAATSTTTSGSGASTAIGIINKTIARQALTAPINIADFAKQATALTAIGPLSQAEITGALAQAKKLVSQAADVLSTEKGFGAFGFSADQLEKAGIIKPGMSKFIKSGAATLENLLKSPAAFTGKDAINSAQDLLSNLPKQELIQQDLMKNGLAALSALGVPPLALSAAGAAGAALNSAVSSEHAANFLKGAQAVGSQLSEKFATTTRDAAFAAAFANTKIPPAFKAEITPIPASNTVNRDTVDAAALRVIGNSKVPEPNYGTVTLIRSVAEQTTQLKSAFSNVALSFGAIENISLRLEASLSELEIQSTIADADFDAINNEVNRLNFVYLAQSKIFAQVREAFDSASPDVQLTNRKAAVQINSTITELASTIVNYKNRIAELSRKRRGLAPT